MGRRRPPWALILALAVAGSLAVCWQPGQSFAPQAGVASRAVASTATGASTAAGSSPEGRQPGGTAVAIASCAALAGALAAVRRSRHVGQKRQGPLVQQRFFGGGSEPEAPGGSVYDFTVKDIDGQEVPLKNYEGKLLLIVNVASK